MEEKVDIINQEVLKAKEDLYGFSFRWMKGEQTGTITDLQDVILDDNTGIIWVYFTDGNRINYTIIDEFMLRLDGQEANEIREKAQSNPSSQQRKGRNIQVIDSNTSSNNYSSESPIRSLLQKQKPNWVEVNFKLKLNLPPKTLYDVLKGSFDDAEKEIIDFVVDDMDIELIKDALRKNIQEIYKKNGTERRQPVQEDDTQ